MPKEHEALESVMDELPSKEYIVSFGKSTEDAVSVTGSEKPTGLTLILVSVDVPLSIAPITLSVMDAGFAFKVNCP